MENLQFVQQGGGEKHQNISDKHFEDFFDCDVLDIFQMKEELASGSIEQEEPFISFYDTSDSGSNSYENVQEESDPPIQLSIVSSYTQLVPILNPIPKKKKNNPKPSNNKPKKSQMIEINHSLEQLNFDPETGTLSCKYGVFQHLQYLFPEHPLIIQTKNDDKWSRINEAVRKYLTKAGENKSFISISPKGEHSGIYKLIKELKFLKQRNSYLLIAIDKKDHLEKYLDQRWNNKRNTKKRKNSEESEEQEVKEKQKKIKKDQPVRKNSKETPVNVPQPEVKQEINSTFHNLFARVDRSVVIIKDQQKASCIKVSLEGSEQNLPSIIPLISPDSPFYDKSIEPKKDLPHYLLSSSQLNNLKQKKLVGDFKDPFDSSKLNKLGVNPNDKGSWLDFVEKLVGLPKLCKSESFDLLDNLSQFSFHLIQFFDLLSCKNKSFDSVVIKGVSSPVFQVLRISGDLGLLVERLLSVRKQAKICLDNFGSYEDTSKLISEEYILRVELTNKIKQIFDYLVRGDNQLAHGKYFFEEYIVNFSVCGSCLLIKDDKVDILGNFDQQEEEVVSPSRFFEEILSKTSLEIGKSLRLFLSSCHSSFFVTLRFYSSNLSVSQLFLHDIEISYDQNLLPLSFVLSPSLQRDQFLFVSHHFHQGNVADLLLNKFPLHFDHSSFPHIHPQINRVLFIPQQNLTRIDYSLVLESERYISLSSSSFKQLLTTIL